MRCQAVSWLAAMLVTAIHTQSCNCAQKASSRLNVTLEGSVLSWTLHFNHTAASSDAMGIVQYSVRVYASTAPQSEALFISEGITDTTFDLKTLTLQEGTYYIQVQAFVRLGNSQFSEIIVYKIRGTGSHSSSQTTTLLATTISVLAVAMVVGSLLFALTMWRIRARGKHGCKGGSKVTMDSTCMVCPCTQQPTRNAQCSRDGLQLPTIEARDKNNHLIPVYLANRDRNATRLDSAPTKPDRDNLHLPTIEARDKNKHFIPVYLASHDRNVTRPNTAPAKPDNSNRLLLKLTGGGEDLPYGYVSPADINIPGLRRQLAQHQLASRERERDSKQPTPREADVTRSVPVSESLQSIPCSFTSSMENGDDSANYLTILPS